LLIDANELQDGAKFETDICIIGSGAAGITLVKSLEGSLLNIVMLESGGLEFDSEAQKLAEGEISARKYFDLDVTRLRYFGGSTNHWGGRCLPLKENDFAVRTWIPHSGWPISLSDLDLYYRRAHSIIGLGQYDYDVDDFAKVSGHPLFPFNDGPVRSILTRTLPLRFGKTYRQDIADSKTTKAILNAHVLSLETNDQASKVTDIKVSTLSGKKLSVSARTYVIACGGIENPRLLLLSNKIKASGIGNDNDQVGRYFMEHLLYSGGLMPISDVDAEYRIYGDYIKSDGVDMQSTLAFDQTFLKENQLPNLYFELQKQRGYGFTEGALAASSIMSAAKRFDWPDDLSNKVVTVAKDLDLLIDGAASSAFDTTVFHDKVPLAFRLYAFGEQIPNPDSRITLGTKKDAFGLPVTNLSWRTTDADIRGIHKAFEILAREAGRSGLGRVRVMLDNNIEPPLSRLSGGHHHMGTTRMSSDPKHGVVDANCRVHGVDNLFIAGSSVFSTSGFANPTLTIVALAARLSDHLKDIMTYEQSK